MRLRQKVFSTTIIFLTIVSANAFKMTSPWPPSTPSPLSPLSPSLAEDEVFRAAYDDTMHILSEMNECSDFFGGPAASLDVFNELVGRVQKDALAPSIGIQMSGAITNVVRMETGRKHRLFDKVSINSNGAFYRHRNSETQASIYGVGRFQPNTRGARVLMLLHELGHIVQAEGKWLLPDDGHDADLSRSNTRRIEDVCGREIRNLGKVDTALNSVNGKVQDERPTPVEAGP